MFRFEILPTIWHLAHVLQNLKTFLNKMGQLNPLCSTFQQSCGGQSVHRMQARDKKIEHS